MEGAERDASPEGGAGTPGADDAPDPAEVGAPDNPAEAGATPGAEAPQEEVAALREALDEATARADGYLERLKRLQAEFDNFRKRKRREVEDAKRHGGDRLIGELLDVLGSFDRALDGASGGDESLHDGVALIYKQLKAVLAREGVERIEAEGHPFDPEVHEAVMREETSAYADGVIIKELERGYTRGGRVLRPAKVKVAVRPRDAMPSND